MANKSFTILAIDDHADNLAAIRVFLADAFSSMTVLTAQTGEVGIAFARQHHPSLILLDMLMPNMDGYEVCRRMKQDPDIRHIPVIFLTTQKDNRDVRIKGIESGAEGFLSKPLDKKELLAQICATLKLSEVNEQEHVEKQIASLTCPMNKDCEITFEELFDLKEIQRIQDEFASATSVASIITRLDGTPITHPSNFTRFCQDFVRASEKGCLNCRKSDVALGRLYPEGPIVQPCLSGGLWDASVNIIVGGQHIANWLIGQVRDGTQTEENVLIYARELGLNEQAFIQAFCEVPVMSQEQFNKIAKVLFTLATQLSTQAYTNIQQARLIADEKRYIKELRQLSAAIEQSSEEIVITDATGIIQYVNPAFVKTTGYTQEEALGQNPRFLQGKQQENTFYEELWGTVSAGQTWRGQFINKRKDGIFFTEDAAISPVCDSEGKIVNYVAVKRDISAHIRLSEELQQAQKMESIGRLAGGVAHDFNNMLQVIIGIAQLAMEDLSPSTLHYSNFNEIYKAGRRSADLTQQLLAFARKQPTAPVVFDLNQTIESILKLLQRLIGESIQINFRPQADLGCVKMDPSQMDQILTNLSLNARDATHGTGEILIETGSVIFDEAFCSSHHDLQPGEYLRVTVRDYGDGMDSETLAHVFEPFFTTKRFGRGTGLGLSMVYGVIKQNKGHIEVQSALGQGTTFDIYLPKKLSAVPMSNKENPSVDLSLGSEVILLAEDEASVLKICQRYLEEAGYTVLGANTPEKALNIAKAYPGKIHLLLSDIVMPNMSGIDLQKQLIVSRPSIRTIFMTGYTSHAFRQKDASSNDMQVLMKPFLIKDLLQAVRKTLDSHIDKVSLDAGS